jgi:hypothetical protein
MERAVKERVLMVKERNRWKEPWRPSVEQFKAKVSNFTKHMNRQVRYSTPMKATDFSESYQGRKRTRYQNALELNRLYGFSDKSAIIRCFVKHEKYLFTNLKPVIPRLIQPRDDRYLVETGRFIKPIEKLIYKGINTIYRSVVVCKGMNMLDRGNLLWSKWSRFKRPVAVGLDASKFDRHVSNAALEWEHSIYQRFYPGNTFLKRLLKLQRCNEGYGNTPDGFLHYVTEHNRASGDSNTSCGNVLIMCGLFWEYVLTHVFDMEFVNDGDDCVVILEEDDLYKLSEIQSWFKDAGFPLVTEDPVRIFEKIEFCQAQPVSNGDGGYTMVRNVHKVVGKDAVALKPLDNQKIKKMWMAAVGDGGLCLSSGIPVMQEYYGMFKRNSDGAKALRDPTMEDSLLYKGLGMEFQYRPPTPESRLSFWLAFDITPTEQLCLEEYYSGLTLMDGDIENRFALIPI